LQKLSNAKKEARPAVSTKSDNSLDYIVKVSAQQRIGTHLQTRCFHHLTHAMIKLLTIVYQINRVSSTAFSVVTFPLEEILNFLGWEIPRNVQDSSCFLFMDCTFPTTGNFYISQTFPDTV